MKKVLIFLFAFSFCLYSCSTMISDLGKKNKKETQTQEQTQNQNETQNQGSQEHQEQQNQEQNQQSGEQNQQGQQGQQTDEQNQQEHQGQEQQSQQNEGQGQQEQNQQGQQEQQTQPEITYQILHYKQNILDDEYTLFESETITAQAGTLTTAKAKPYYGFTSKDFSQAGIASDSSTKVSIYYDRKEFTITFNLNGGSFPQDQNCPLTITAKYETQLDIPSPEKSNYIFCGWNKIGGGIPETMTKNGAYNACWIRDSETPQYIVSYSTEYGTAPDSFIVYSNTIITPKMLPELRATGKKFDGWFIGEQQIFGNDYTINSNIKITAHWSQGAPVYTVKHWKKSLNNKNILFETEELEGIKGFMSQVQPKQYEGFEAETFDQKIIQSSGTIIDIYYKRKTYSIELDLGTTLGTEIISGLYESPFNYANPELQGYIFKGWNTPGGKLPSMITKNETYTAIWSDSGTTQGISLGNLNLEINVTSSLENNIYTFTAQEGFENYIWKIDTMAPDGVTQIVNIQSPNILTLTDYDSLLTGLYIINLTASKNGLDFSKRILLNKN